MTPQPIKVLGTGITGPKTFKNRYLNLDGRSDLTFTDITFDHCGQIRGDAAKRISFLRCKFLYLLPNNEKYVQLFPGNDDWIFEHCVADYMGDFIYSNYNNDQNADGAQRVTVLNCTASHIGTTPEHPSRDGHFCGLQGGSGHVISGNVTDDTGTAIELWAHKDMPMRGCLIEDNHIRHARTLYNEDGSGIKFSGEAGAAKGLHTGTICRNNNIKKCDGWGISSNWPDEISGLSSNHIKDCRKGSLRITGVSV